MNAITLNNFVCKGIKWFYFRNWKIIFYKTEFFYFIFTKHNIQQWITWIKSFHLNVKALIVISQPAVFKI